MMKRKSVRIVAGLLAFLVVANFSPVVWGSIFGEENATLVSILAQSIEAKNELQTLNDAASASAGLMTDLRDTYANVNAGYEELKNYSFDSFLDDFRDDVYQTYPGFGELEYATSNLAAWDDTRTRSPFTAYEAITAVAGDLSEGLRDDVEAGRANVDRELMLKGEAAGGFALAAGAEEATRRFDDDTSELARFAQDSSPGASQQLSAKALVMIAAQNSHIIRLLARGVRLDGVDKAIQYGERMDAKNAAYDRRLDSAAFVDEAVQPPKMFGSGGISADELETVEDLE